MEDRRSMPRRSSIQSFTHRTGTVDHLIQLFTGALNDTAQTHQLLGVLKRLTARDGEQACHLHGLTSQGLHFRSRSVPTRTMPAHPGRPGKILFVPLAFSKQSTTSISDAVYLLSFDFVNSHKSPVLQHLQ